jgi:hypothetical protein
MTNAAGAGNAQHVHRCVPIEFAMKRADELCRRRFGQPMFGIHSIHFGATEALIDLRWRGGMLMISRDVSPLWTFESALANASVSQFCEKGAPGTTVSKTFSIKAHKSTRNTLRNYFGVKVAFMPRLS